VLIPSQAAFRETRAAFDMSLAQLVWFAKAQLFKSKEQGASRRLDGC
jgi:hypothetical protein